MVRVSIEVKALLPMDNKLPVVNLQQPEVNDLSALSGYVKD
jgi:hypothetical protein